VPFYHLMRTYDRRFAAMARSRRTRGVWGRRNDCRRFMFGGYTFEGGSAKPILLALLAWFRLEVSEGWRSWFEPRASVRSMPLAAPVETTI
jgi:hypothetical protein